MMTENRLPDEKWIQLFLEAADSLTETAREELSAVHRATLALQNLNTQVNTRLRELQDNVSLAINSSAEKTASEAAVLLNGHFRAANEAAREAREGYERTARGLKQAGLGGLHSSAAGNHCDGRDCFLFLRALAG